MYGAKLDGRIIAIHDDSEMVWEFISQQNDHDVSFVKFKKKYVKTLEENGELYELYLVKMDGKCIPRCLIRVLENDEYRCCIDMLKSILENEDLDGDDIKTLKKAMKIIRKLIREQTAESINVADALKISAELKEYDEMFRDKAFTE
ncbi:MAG: hypothetical protein K2O54_08065 [Prevotella sp.]|nr:hypothetical protein [Prevotella sp.]